MQQRGLPPIAMELYHLYGREQHQNGSSVLYFDKRARKKAKRALEQALDRFDKLSNAYVIVGADDRAVITVGHLYKRIKKY